MHRPEEFPPQAAGWQRRVKWLTFLNCCIHPCPCAFRSALIVGEQLQLVNGSLCELCSILRIPILGCQTRIRMFEINKAKRPATVFKRIRLIEFYIIFTYYMLLPQLTYHSRSISIFNYVLKGLYVYKMFSLNQSTDDCKLTNYFGARLFLVSLLHPSRVFWVTHTWDALFIL